MGAPAWLTGIFAVLMLIVAVYCAGRLVAARRWRRPTELDTDGGHVLMGVAMAGMLVARLRIVPAAAWEAVFAVGAAWFAWQLLRSRRGAAAHSWRCPQPAPHLVECTAMLYMLVILPPSLASRGAAAGMAVMTAPASRFSFLALLMALFMFGYVVRVTDRLTVRSPALVIPAAPVAGSPAEGSPPPGSRGPDGTRPVRPYLAPRCAALCNVAMGLTMGYMLILML